MRTIKFRAWDKTQPIAEMLQWETVRSNFGWYLDDIGIILMQFTGLLDKNGKEIYEGDIVEWDDGSQGKWRRRCEIRWEKSKYILVGFYYDANIQNSPRESIKFEFGAFIYEYDYALEIIGNIYQNSELLQN